MDITARLFRERILLLNQYITADVSNNLIAILLYLRNEDSTKPITLYCNFPGGELVPTMALYDTLQQVRQDRGAKSKSGVFFPNTRFACPSQCKAGGMPISVLNMGSLSGLGCFVAAAGSPGRR